jgi:hypothetical protein
MQKQEVFERCIPSMENSIDLAGYAIVIEEAREEPQRKESSRACETCMEDPCVLAGFSLVTKDATSQKILKAGLVTEFTNPFVKVIEGLPSQED